MKTNTNSENRMNRRPRGQKLLRLDEGRFLVWESSPSEGISHLDIIEHRDGYEDSRLVAHERSPFFQRLCEWILSPILPSTGRSGNGSTSRPYSSAIDNPDNRTRHHLKGSHATDQNNKSVPKNPKPRSYVTILEHLLDILLREQVKNPSPGSQPSGFSKNDVHHLAPPPSPVALTINPVHPNFPGEPIPLYVPLASEVIWRPSPTVTSSSPTSQGPAAATSTTEEQTTPEAAIETRPSYNSSDTPSESISDGDSYNLESNNHFAGESQPIERMCEPFIHEDDSSSDSEPIERMCEPLIHEDDSSSDSDPPPTGPGVTWNSSGMVVIMQDVNITINLSLIM